MKRFILYSILLAVFATTACEDPLKNELFVDDSKEQLLTASAYLESRSDEFSLFIDLLHYADLYNALNDASKRTTLFAPNNDAMRAFMELKQITSFEELDYEYARELVKIHIIRDQGLSESQFTDFVNTGQIPMLTDFGTYLSASYGYKDIDVDDVELPNVQLQDSMTIYLDNMASVLELEWPTANDGTLYVLGGVIRPLVETVVQKLRDYQEYTIFIEAIEAAGLDSLLSISSDTTYTVNGLYTVNAVNYTCFAVPDAIYRNAGITDFQALCSFLQAGSDYDNPENGLNRYLRYHLFDRVLKKNDLMPDTGQLELFDTMLRGEVIMMENIGGEMVINKNISLVHSDINCKNGIIHKINQVMPVYQPERATIIWDFCSNKDIISIVNQAGASKGLGDLFTSPLTGQESRVDLNSSFGKLSGEDFQYSLQTKKGNWEAIGFFKCKYKDQSDLNVNNYGALNNNLFIVSVGQLGWVQIKTPTIVKGKYRVELYHACNVTLASMYPAGSQTCFSFDEKTPEANTKFVQVWRGAQRLNEEGIGTYIYKEVLWDEIEFATTASHTFKASMQDGLAATNNQYRQMWDYLKFIPID